MAYTPVSQRKETLEQKSGYIPVRERAQTPQVQAEQPPVAAIPTVYPIAKPEPQDTRSLFKKYSDWSSETGKSIANNVIDLYKKEQEYQENTSLLRKVLDPFGSVRRLQENITAKALNTKTAAKITGEVYERTSNLGLKGYARIQSLGDQTYEEAYNALLQKKDDPTNDRFERIIYGLADSGIQSVAIAGLGIAASIATRNPATGRIITGGLFGSVATEAERMEKGAITPTGTRNILIDTAGDMVISNWAESALKTFGTKQASKLLSKEGAAHLSQNIAKAFGIEGGTEVVQSLAKYGNEYASAKTQEERSSVVNALVEYVKSGAMVDEFLIGGIAGGVIGAGVDVAGYAGLGGMEKLGIQPSPEEEEKKYRTTKEAEKDVAKQTLEDSGLAEDIRNSLETNSREEVVASLSQELGIQPIEAERTVELVTTYKTREELRDEIQKAAAQTSRALAISQKTTEDLEAETRAIIEDAKNKTNKELELLFDELNDIKQELAKRPDAKMPEPLKLLPAPKSFKMLTDGTLNEGDKVTLIANASGAKKEATVVDVRDEGVVARVEGEQPKLYQEIEWIHIPKTVSTPESRQAAREYIEKVKQEQRRKFVEEMEKKQKEEKEKEVPTKAKNAPKKKGEKGTKEERINAVVKPEAWRRGNKYSVVYELDGKTVQKTGFKTDEDANAWIDDNATRSERAEKIHKMITTMKEKEQVRQAEKQEAPIAKPRTSKISKDEENHLFNKKKVAKKKVEPTAKKGGDEGKAKTEDVKIGIVDTHPSYTEDMNNLIREAKENGESFPYTKMSKEEQKIVDTALQGKIEGSKSVPKEDTTEEKTPRGWRDGYEEETDVYKKEAILKSIANLKSTEKEQEDVLKRLVEISKSGHHGEIPGIAWDVAQNPASSEETKKEALALREKITEPFNIQTFLDEQKTVIKNLQEGTITPEELQRQFNLFIGRKDDIYEWLEKMTIAEIQRRFIGYRTPGDKKSNVVKHAYQNLAQLYAPVGSFTWSPFSETYEEALSRFVNTATAETIKEYSDKRKEDIARREAEKKRKEEALVNPQTLYDYQALADAKGLDNLTTEQRLRYDELQAEKAKAETERKTRQKALVQGVRAGVGFDMKQTKHTKTGADLFVVTMDTRVEKDVYRDLVAAAKKLGGYYSSFRGTGAIPGFQFKTAEDAQKFMSVGGGETVSTIEKVEEKKEARTEKRANRLLATAEALEARAAEKLNQPRLTNTPRRARMASGVEADARYDLQIAQTMKNLSAAIESGRARFLDDIYAKTQVEHIEYLLRGAQSRRAREIETQKRLDGASYVDYNEIRQKVVDEGITDDTILNVTEMTFSIPGESIWKDVLEKTEKMKGYIQLTAKYKRIIPQGDKRWTIENSVQHTELETLAKAAKVTMGQTKNMLDEYKASASLGAKNVPELRAIIREYVTFRGGEIEADKVKELERELIGKNVGVDFFPTPKNVAEEMVRLAGIAPGMKVLEPSAGNGNIAEAIRETGATVHVGEISGDLRGVLEAKGFDIVADDFLQYTEGDYDAIIQNPPFSNDIEHVKHAYDLLAPGGKLVSIVGEGTFIRSGKKEQEFREWLDENDAHVEQLAEGTFQDKTLMRTTGARGRMVYMEKPLAPQFMISEGQETTREAISRLEEESFFVSFDDLNLMNDEEFTDALGDVFLGQTSQTPLPVLVIKEKKGKNAGKYSILDGRHRVAKAWDGENKTILVTENKELYDSVAAMLEEKRATPQFKISETLEEEEHLEKAKDALRKAKGLSASDIMAQYPDINLKKDVVVTDIHGKKSVIPEGEALTPYELKGNKVLLQDGETYIVSKNQWQNIKGQAVSGEAKPFAPELEGLEETVKGVNVKSPLGAPSTAPKYSSYTLPDGKNYKEILVRAPSVNQRNNLIAEAKNIAKKNGYDFDESRLTKTNSYGQTELDEISDALFENPEGKRFSEIADSLVNTKGEESMSFKSSHWDEPNVLFHIRMNWRKYKGKAVAFMEEIQSDWAREARAGGTEATNPLLKNWQELSVKRALKEAVESGAEYFAWINGEQTSARYNLATHVENVEWNKLNSGKKFIKILPKEGGVAQDIGFTTSPEGIILDVPNRGQYADWQGKKLDEVLGKGLADKIMEKESGTLSGEGLKFGGEWANNLYDKQVRDIVKKLTGQEPKLVDMGLPALHDRTKFIMQGGRDAGGVLTKNKIEVGLEINIDSNNGASDYIITDVIGNGKFKALKTSIMRGQGALSVKDIVMWANNNPSYKEEFSLNGENNQKQYMIDLTPEVKRIILGEAPDLKKPSGKSPLTAPQFKISETLEDAFLDGFIEQEDVVRILNKINRQHNLNLPPAKFVNTIYTGGKIGQFMSIKEGAEAVTLTETGEMAFRRRVPAIAPFHEATHQMLDHMDEMEELFGYSQAELIREANGGKDPVTQKEYLDIKERIVHQSERAWVEAIQTGKWNVEERFSRMDKVRDFIGKVVEWFKGLINAKPTTKYLLEDFFKKVIYQRNRQEIRLRDPKLLDLVTRDGVVDFGKKGGQFMKEGDITTQAAKMKADGKTFEEFVKAQGTPVYHGTASKFSKFDKTKIGETTGTGDWGDGFYFSDSKDVARSFANDAGGDIVMEVHLKDLNFADGNKLEKLPEVQAILDDGMGFGDIGEYLKSKGYDGVKYKHAEGESTEYVVYSADKIKTRTQLEEIWNKAGEPPQFLKIENIDEYDALPSKEREKVYSTLNEELQQEIAERDIMEEFKDEVGYTEEVIDDLLTGKRHIEIDSNEMADWRETLGKSLYMRIFRKPDWRKRGLSWDEVLAEINARRGSMEQLSDYDFRMRIIARAQQRKTRKIEARERSQRIREARKKQIAEAKTEAERVAILKGIARDIAEEIRKKRYTLKQYVQAIERGEKRGEKKVRSVHKDRAQQVKNLIEIFNLTDSEVREILGRRDYRTMTEEDYLQFLNEMEGRAMQLNERSEAYTQLMGTIWNLELNRVENLQFMLGMPKNFADFTTEQLIELERIVSQYQLGDTFLGPRTLQLIDRTDLSGVRTWREVKERLANESGVSYEQISDVSVSEFDRMRWDTSLAEKNAFYRLIVTETQKQMISADMNYQQVEQQTTALIRAARRSRSRELNAKDRILQGFIPTDERIFAWLEADQDGKTRLASEMTEEELTAAMYIQEQFARMRDQLIANGTMEKYRENYVTHIRRGFLEAWKDDGVAIAFKELFEKNDMDKAVFTILDEKTGEILPLEKWFGYALRRSGNLVPTQNVASAFLSYTKAFERKTALDRFIPKLAVYAGALTPLAKTPHGLEMDDSIKRFVNEYLNSKKGRTTDIARIQQGGYIDRALRSLDSLIVLHDLGLNIPVSLASQPTEVTMTYINIGAKKTALGIARLRSKKGLEITRKYEQFVGKTPFDALFETTKGLGDKMLDGSFALFRSGTVRANKIHLLGSLTKEEWESGELSVERLAQLRLEIGRYRVVEGTESIYGKGTAGGVLKRYKTWAVVPLRTTSKNLLSLAKMVREGDTKVLSSREFQETFRASMVIAVISLIAMSVGDEEDDSFSGTLTQKMIRDAYSIIQSYDPKVYMTVRMATFLEDLGSALSSILRMEEYEDTGSLLDTKGGTMRGDDELIRVITPVLFKQYGQ